MRDYGENRTQNADMPEELMTIEELADYLRVSRRVAGGLDIPCISVTGAPQGRRWRRGDVDRWIEQQIAESTHNLRRGAEEEAAIRFDQ